VLNKSFTGSLGCSLLDDLARVEVELNFVEVVEHDRVRVGRRANNTGGFRQGCRLGPHCIAGEARSSTPWNHIRFARFSKFLDRLLVTFAMSSLYEHLARPCSIGSGAQISLSTNQSIWFGAASGAAQPQPLCFAHQRGPGFYEPCSPSSLSLRTTAPRRAARNSSML
jgi:hypothetical protein